MPNIHGIFFQMLEEITDKLSSMSCIRILSQATGAHFVGISELETGSVDSANIFQTVSPAIAFQYMSDTSLDTRLNIIFLNPPKKQKIKI